MPLDGERLRVDEAAVRAHQRRSGEIRAVRLQNREVERAAGRVADRDAARLEADPLSGEPREGEPCVLARDGAGHHAQRRAAGSDLSAHVGRHVVEGERGAAEGRPLRVDQDRVGPARGERPRVDEAAVRAHQRRCREIGAVRLEDREVQRATGRGADRDSGCPEADALPRHAVECESRVLARDRTDADARRTASGSDRPSDVGRDVVEREGRAARAGVLWIDQDRVRAGCRQRSRVDKAAVRPHRGRRNESRPVRPRDRERHRAAGRRAERDAADLQADPLSGGALEDEPRVLPSGRGGHGQRRAVWCDRVVADRRSGHGAGIGEPVRGGRCADRHRPPCARSEGAGVEAVTSVGQGERLAVCLGGQRDARGVAAACCKESDRYRLADKELERRLR